MPRKKKLFVVLLTCFLLCAMALPAAAAGRAPAATATPAPNAAATPPDVASVIENTWKSAAVQIKTVVNSVVFPAMDMILAVAFFVKLGTCYFDYRKHGQMEWTPPVILFACLVFTLTAPQYIWTLIGI